MTHDFKFAGVYDLPFGKGHQWVNQGPAAWIIGGWRVSSINVYDSGTPVSISTSLTLPIYASGVAGRVAPYVTSYNGWQPNWTGRLRSREGQLLRAVRHRPVPAFRAAARL